jgi:hypothetical protein
MILEFDSKLQPIETASTFAQSESRFPNYTSLPNSNLFHGVTSHVFVRAQRRPVDAGIRIRGKRQFHIATSPARVAPLIRLDKSLAEQISLAPESDIPALRDRVVRLDADDDYLAIHGTYRHCRGRCATGSSVSQQYRSMSMSKKPISMGSDTHSSLRLGRRIRDRLNLESCS